MVEIDSSWSFGRLHAKKMANQNERRRAKGAKDEEWIQVGL